MKKIALFTALAFAAVLSFHAEALDLILKNGQMLPNVTIVNTLKNKVTLVSTSINGESTLRSVRFSELTNGSLNALKQYFMENINSYMEPARPAAKTNLTALRELQQYSKTTQPDTVNNPNQGQLLFSAAPAMTISLNPVFPNQVTTPPPAQQQPTVNSGSQNSQIILPTFPHNINFLSLGMITSGSLGIATSAPGDSADGPLVNHYGRIYIYGVSVPQNADWIGTVYPTSKTIIFNGVTYPCYATSQDMANQISNSNQ